LLFCTGKNALSAHWVQAMYRASADPVTAL